MSALQLLHNRKLALHVRQMAVVRRIVAVILLSPPTVRYHICPIVLLVDTIAARVNIDANIWV